MNSKLTARSSHVQTGGAILGASSDVNVQQRERAMTWNTPKIVEIAVGLEINSYACATV